MSALQPPTFETLFTAQACIMDCNIDTPQVIKEHRLLINVCLNDIDEMDVESLRKIDNNVSLVSDLQLAYKVWPFIHVIYISALTDEHDQASAFLGIWFRGLYPN